jgi:dolichol-phosphate mannosyltransferase
VRVSIIVPTYNEELNVGELLARIAASTDSADTEVIVVDDSTDGTPDAVARAAAMVAHRVRLIHRLIPEHGLSGAVIEGMAASSGDWCVVIDGDLQHPPELIPLLVAAGDSSGAGIVVASRYRDGGSSTGLGGVSRRLASRLSTAAAKALFPERLRDCTDPMTGFFAVRRELVDLGSLQPRGFKILLEILVRNDLRVTEVPFAFDARNAGSSKATLGQGVAYLRQLLALRLSAGSRQSHVENPAPSALETRLPR